MSTYFSCQFLPIRIVLENKALDFSFIILILFFPYHFVFVKMKMKYLKFVTLFYKKTIYRDMCDY